MGSGAGGIYQETYGSRLGIGGRSQEVSGQPLNANERKLSRPRAPRENRTIASQEDDLLAKNAQAMKEEYDLHEDGFFAREGARRDIRIRESEDPMGDSRDFFERISAGGKDIPEPKVDALRKLPDGTRVNYRRITKTPDSPAVQISRSKSDAVKNQKVHFVKGGKDGN